jgi:CheY-like chemotaxis protein
MDSAVAGIWCQAAAVAAWGTVGGVLVRLRGERPGTTVVGAGLLVGAMLLAIDTMRTTGRAIPLAGLALVVTSWLAHATRGPGLAAVLARNGLRLTTCSVVLLAVLHWLHGVLPTQANYGLPWFDVHVVDGPLALGAFWLALRGNGMAADVRFLVLVTAAGQLASCAAGAYGVAVAAGAQVLAATPLLLRRLANDPPALAVAAATAGMFAFTGLVRAQADLQQSTPRLAGIDDPLLVVATCIAMLGVALLRAYGREGPVLATPGQLRDAGAHHLTTVGASGVGQPNELAQQTSQPLDAEVSSATVSEPPAPSTIPEPRGLSAHDIVRDLRGPITSMVAAVGLLSPEATADERRRQLDSLRSYGRQLSTALTDLDDFEQLLRGNVDLAEDAYDLGQLLHNCVDELSPKLSDRGLQVRLDVSPTLPRWLLGDPSRVRQLLTRLLQLASQPANFGELDVSASADDTLHVVVMHQDATMPDDRQSLGFVFCTRLALVLGGELQLQPSGSNGFLLHLKLPKRMAPAWEVDLLEVDTASPTEPDAPKVARSVHGRVLLVEDSPDHLLLLGRLAVKAGAQVTTADSGELAMQLTESETFDLILLDMQLPGTDGYATVKKWRDQGLTTPVIAVTADATPADVERCLSAGCNGHLAKPVQPAVFRQAITMHLQASTPD